MGLQDAFKDITEPVSAEIGDAVQTIKHDAKDAASEDKHQAEAHAEASKRASTGDSLSPLAVAASLTAQVRDETLANFDSLKQTIRKDI